MTKMFGPQVELIPETPAERELQDLQRDLSRLEQERRFLARAVVQARLKKALMRLQEVRRGIEPVTPIE